MNAVLFTSLVILVPAPKGMEEPVNPFAKAKVGDWVEYRLELGQMPGGIQAPVGLTGMKFRTVITAATEKEVTLEMHVSAGDDAPANPTQKMTIDPRKPYNPLTFLDIGIQGRGKSRKKEEGHEKITVGGKTYECTWYTVNGGDQNLTDVKIWVSKEVPLTGMLRMESKAVGFSITFEMVGSGRK